MKVTAVRLAIVHEDELEINEQEVTDKLSELFSDEDLVMLAAKKEPSIDLGQGKPDDETLAKWAERADDLLTVAIH